MIPSVALKVSGRNSLIREFQSEKPLLSRSAGEKGPEPITNQPRESGLVCGSRQVDPFNASLNFVLDFLTNMFDKSSQYRTIKKSQVSNFCISPQN